MSDRVCDCGRQHDDPVRKGRGDLLVCASCGGFIRCDVCRREGRYTPGVSFALFTVAGSFICRDHSWTAMAQRKGEGE